MIYPVKNSVAEVFQNIKTENMINRKKKLFKNCKKQNVVYRRKDEKVLYDGSYCNSDLSGDSKLLKSISLQL